MFKSPKKRLQRDPDSHKGQNGKVLVVGGSMEYHGAPIFSALGALNSGADLVYMAVPEVNFEVTRNFAPDFIIRKYPGEYLNTRAAELILGLAQKVNVVVIGPGLGDRPEILRVVKNLVESLDIPIILDAGAIQVLEMIDKFPLKNTIIITPHHYEFEKLIGKSFKVNDPAPHKTRLIRTLATDLKLNILLKGPIDIIASEKGEVEENDTGNAGMTVGGSGDVLTGVVASFMAQGLSPFDACASAAYSLGKAGDRLFKSKGYTFSSTDLAMELPYVIKDLID
jgi:ADP-dependent NAD(P)H-hydrate dehydratase / NAD(P)H-hydrate epimerase